MTSTKRFVTKVVLAIAILITALTLVALFSLLPRLMPTYNFLGGQRPLNHFEDNRYRIDVYSFQANISSFHKKVKAELTSLGYTERIPAEQEIMSLNTHLERQWELPDRSVIITFRDNWRLQVVPGSSPNRYWDYAEDGWITVKVRQRRR